MIAVASRSQKESCVAVTHSTFLRILLAMMLDRPLFEASSMSVVNGGVSIIDVPRELRTRHIGKTSNSWNQDIGLEVPICRVIRINETRHLPTVPVLI